MKQDFQGWMLNLLRDILLKNRDYFNRISDQSDKIVVWLVGFSVASIALSIGNKDMLNKVIPNISGTILIFGALTSIFGILYRIMLYLSQAIEIQMLISFEGYIEGYNNLPQVHYGRDITENDTYDDILGYLNIDFEIDFEKPNLDGVSEDEIKIARDHLLEYYNSLNNWHNNQLASEISGIKETLKIYLGYSNKKLDKIFNPKEPKIKLTSAYWFCLYSAISLFLLCCAAFTTGMIFLLFKYLVV